MQKIVSRSIILTILALGGLSGLFHPRVQAAASLELYVTFEAMGVIVSLDPADDPDGDANTHLEYCPSGSGAYQVGFPLTRVSDTRFVGSLFWLEPGTSYDVRVSFSDPDGDLLDGTFVEGSASTHPEVTIPTAQDTFYASPTGGGTTCSFLTPCTLIEALDKAQAGDEVVLRGGTYYQGEIAIPRSGFAGAPILIRGYEAEEAVLDGADPTTFSWTDQGNGVFYTTLIVGNPHVVMADKMRLFPYDDLTDLESLSRDNMPGFYASGTDLYVHLVGDADPTNAEMAVSRHNYAFYVEQDFIYFQNLTFRHYGQGSYAKAIYFNNASDNLVAGCTFASNDLGIGIKRASHRNLIQDSEFYDTIFDWSWDDVKEVSGLEDGGILFYDPVDGRGNTIRRNTFHDDFDGFGICPDSTSAVTNETDVYQNLAYNLGDDGVEADGTCSNVRLWGNTFHDVLMGISFAPVYGGPVYAIRNLFYNTGVGNNIYSGSPFKFNSGYGQSGTMYLFHNTSDAILPGNNGIYIKEPGTWDLIYARNNIWSGTEFAINDYNQTQPIDFDYDNLYTSNPDEFAYWGSDHLYTLEAFQAATGQELNGLNVESGFRDAIMADFRLNPDSDLIDAGVLIPGINHGYFGTAPDMGAYEFYNAIYLPLITQD